MSLQVGQELHCILHGGRDGVISAIHGEQSPDTVRNLGGIISTGGRASIDVVWEDGSTSKQVPESIIYSVQWRIHDTVVPAKKVQEMLAFAEKTRVDQEREQREAAKLFADEKAALIAAHPHLKVPNQTLSCSKAAIANIRTELKQFKGVKFSVTQSHGSINVLWEDGVCEKKVNAIVNRYKGGNFNGMEDIYDSKSSPWTSAFGSADYIHARRNNSSRAIEVAIEHLYLALPNNLQSIPRPTAQEYEQGNTRTISVPGLNCELSELITALASAYDFTTGTFEKGDRYSRFDYLVDSVNEALSQSAQTEAESTPVYARQTG